MDRGRGIHPAGTTNGSGADDGDARVRPQMLVGWRSASIAKEERGGKNVGDDRWVSSCPLVSRGVRGERGRALASGCGAELGFAGKLVHSARGAGRWGVREQAGQAKLARLQGCLSPFRFLSVSSSFSVSYFYFYLQSLVPMLVYMYSIHIHNPSRVHLGLLGGLWV